MIIRCPFCQYDFTAPSLPVDCPNCHKTIDPEAEAALAAAASPAPVAPVVQGSVSAPAPVAAPAAGAAPGQATHSSKVAEVMRIVADFLGVVPKVVGGPLVTGVSFVASEALGYVADAVEARGSENADTEAQAEKALSSILATIKDLDSPLPTPSQLEAGAATSGN